MKALLLNTKQDQQLCEDGGYFSDTCGVSGAELFPFHHPLRSVPALGGKVYLPKPFLTDIVDHLYQCIAA